ncbi:MAG TPA: DUF2723 domain-containing protein [Ferruginibacter sp.]|nr:DUF2723 domain-containing protein [Ferruginibacter sp.]HMP21566.1 DUF2723 domain-containing protein [Ferruginibacter sp.]
MNFKRINNITGWIIGIIACTVYVMTMEATGSLWDCGEFASSAYKLQIPHPPGAPLFVLIGRLFMVPFSPQDAATGVNLLSALASGFAVLFLFWSITHFAKKLLLQKGADSLTGTQTFVAMAAGAIGALAYCFSDTAWYSAVEAEVYALSSFFTALVFWAMLKWEDAVTEEQKQGIKGHFTGADRWIILIFYLMGLSIGVHLLNLLTIPAFVMIYFFKRYRVTPWRTFFAFLIGCAITGMVQVVVIQYTIKLAGAFDIMFVNSFGMPFFVGFAFFFVLVAALIWYGLKTAAKKNWNFLRLALWSVAFMLLGYTSYFTTLMRSNADPAVDMYNVDNPVSLVGYLSREQYGVVPLVTGPDFTASNVAGEEYQPDYTTEEVYIKTANGYEKKGRKQDVHYNPEDVHVFPRMWDAGNEQGHADYYAGFAGISKDPKTGAWSDKPTMGDNIRFFTQYQVGWMYLRYFMWNFVGKQNDIQGVQMNNVRDGNWKTGIGFIDKWMLGDQQYMPDSMKHNKANNALYGLPFILGLLGFLFQYKRNRQDTLIAGLLFFFTGLAIVIYLNMPGPMPRERDYAFVGSFYAFAIWIGLGVLAVQSLLSRFLSSSLAGYASAAVCTLAVPVLMAAQEWDDHDRSNKTLARDLAVNYLESCAPNAIVISFGDNDTYPLWYAQEVEGVRRDIRVINSSLLGIDWYINQLRYKLNQSDPIDPIWSAEQIEGAKRDGIYFVQKPGIDPNQPMDLYSMMKDYAGSSDPDKVEQTRDGYTIHTYPTKKVSIPVDTLLVRSNGTVNPDDVVVSQLLIDIPKNMLQKNESAILNIIAANKWKRPIYFTSERAGLGFDRFVRQDGLTYRLVPVENDDVNRPRVADVMMNKFAFGNCDKPGVYFDEENRRHLNTIRLAYATAAANLAGYGKKEEAKKLLEKCDKNMLDENFAYGMVSRYQQHNYISIQFLDACYKAGDTTLAAKVSRSVKKDLQQQLSYYAKLGDMPVQELEQGISRSMQIRYQQERDNFTSTLSRKLRPVYDDAERAYQFLRYMENMEQEYLAKPAVEVPQPIINSTTPGDGTKNK